MFIGLFGGEEKRLNHVRFALQALPPRPGRGIGTIHRMQTVMAPTNDRFKGYD
jgi:hypothetical protein